MGYLDQVTAQMLQGSKKEKTTTKEPILMEDPLDDFEREMRKSEPTITPVEKRLVIAGGAAAIGIGETLRMINKLRKERISIKRTLTKAAVIGSSFIIAATAYGQAQRLNEPDEAEISY